MLTKIRKVELRGIRISLYLRAGVLLLVAISLILSRDMFANNTDTKVKFSLLSSSTIFGPRDHESIYGIDGKVFVYGGFYRGESVYQDLLSSSDYGQNWVKILGSSIPKMNDLLSPILELDVNLPSGYARPLYWNSKHYLVDKDLWLQESKSFVRVVENFLPGLRSASELNILYTKTGIVFIDLASGNIWRFENDLSSFSVDELNFEGVTLKVRGATIFESHGRFFIYGGQVINEKSDEYLEINSINLSSSDGVSWKAIKNLKGSQSRVPFFSVIWTCVVNDARGRTWVLAGYDPITMRNSNDVFMSNDGINFITVESDTKGKNFSPRHAPGCLYLEEKNSVLIVGGKGGPDGNNNRSWVLNDVWHMKLP
jgi:hypothetical protein